MKKTTSKFLVLLLMVIMIFSPFLIYTTYANLFAPYIRVGLLDQFSARSSIIINNTSIIFNQFHRLDSSAGFTVKPYSAWQIALYSENQLLHISNTPLQIQDAFGGLMLLEGTAYRGSMEFARLNDYGLTAINILPLEEYLFSVVPSEMPASWHPEALKAQAVAARTYTLFTMSRGVSHAGFDLCDRVHCQVYRGVKWENTTSTQAVLDTAGLALYFNGQLIEAVYFASSGGITENSENVWLEARPYLRSVSDIHEHEPVIWNRIFTLSEITALIAQNNHNIGTATGVAIGSFHPSGRVESLIISGTVGQVVLTGEEIRTFFNASEDGSLKSRNFILANHILGFPTLSLHGTSGLVATAYGENIQPTVATSSDSIIITGRGFGHGVGMSQRGANGMALRGYTFRDILAHFYNNAVLH